MAKLQDKMARRAKAKAKTNEPHMMIKALAGTGKTTTLIEGLKYMRGEQPQITPSPQQQAIWDALALSRKARTVAFVAFNKSIAAELQRRMPVGCEAKTLHSLGLSAVTKSIGRFKVDGYAASEHLCHLTGKDMRDLRKHDFDLIRGVDRLVSLCKMNLTGFDGKTLLPADCEEEWHDLLDQLASYHDLDFNGTRSQVYYYTPQVLHACLDPVNAPSISFDDMIWLPVVLGLSITKYDVLGVDECQDLNPCQQQLALLAGERLLLCGDEHQAIYGFAGADAQSMQRMEAILSDTPRGCMVLPLTVTRRCSKLVVAEAQKLVPEFEAHPTNLQGSINKLAFSNPDGSDTGTYREVVGPGDMVVCRVNAPLVSQCFKFIKQKRRADIQGREIGKGLIALVNKLKADTVEDLIAKVTDWEHQEVEREQSKRKPSEGRVINIQDKADCILAFCDGAASVAEVVNCIEEMFTDTTDNTNSIRLSSVHKAKGLEAQRVFILEPERATMPHPMAKTAWQREQEWNLRYVAITRSIEDLYYVS